MADTGVVVNDGIAHVISAVVTAGVAKFIGWGTGATTATASNTALGSETATIRCTGTMTIQTSNSTSDTLQVTGLMTATAAYTISEVGLFNSSTSGIMTLRVTFTSIALNASDSIAWTIKAIADQA